MGADRRFSREYFEQVFGDDDDPWDYSNGYETLKYRQTLSLMPTAPRSRVLEVGCAEGAFTCQLAGEVGEVVAVDIAGAALRRARDRCGGLSNVSFARLDLFEDELPGAFDGVVCSELLYFAGSADRVRETGQKITAALSHGGWLLTAHAHVLVDDADSPGFDWAVPFGAKRLNGILAGVVGLELECEAISDLYRIGAFRRVDWSGPSPARPRIIRIDHGELTPELVRYARFPSGGEPELGSE
ncbi:MAG: SAM-dependent methyltransferase [Gaiellaceae bacterium]